MYITKQNNKTVILKNTFTPVFMVALFAILKIWKQLKCTHTHTHTHTPEYYSTIKKENFIAIYSSMDRVEGIMLSEISQIEKDILYDITFMSSKKYNKLVNIKKKSQLIDIENKLVV